MSKIFILFFLVFACHCSGKKNDSTVREVQATNNIDTLNSNIQQPTCKKCDTLIIRTVSEHWDSLTNSQLESFLCSFDTTCDWNRKYTGGSGTYDGAAYEMLVVQLDRHLNKCIQYIDTNKDINFSHILLLLKKRPLLDLPYLSIISQLEQKTSCNSTEQKLLDTLLQGTKI